MELCSEGHDEVCYECHNCPACLAIEQVKSLERDVEVLEEKIEHLEEELGDMDA